MKSFVWLLLLVSIYATSYARQCNLASNPSPCSHYDSMDNLIINSSELEAYDSQTAFFWINFNLSGIPIDNPFVKVFLNDCQLGNEFHCEFVDKDICTIKWNLDNIQLSEDNTKVTYNLWFTPLGIPQCFSSLNLSVKGAPSPIMFTWKIDKCEGIILTFEAVDDTSQWMECILLQQHSKKEIYRKNCTDSLTVPAHLLPKDLISATNNESLSIEVKACNPAGCFLNIRNVSYGKEILEYSVNDKLIELVLVNGIEFQAKITIKLTQEKCVLTIPKYFNVSSNCSNTDEVATFYTAEKCNEDFFVILFPLRHGCKSCSFSIIDNGGSRKYFISEIKTFHVQDMLVLLHADAIFFMCQFMRGSNFNECSFELQISNKSLPVDCCVKKSNKDLQIAVCNITNLTGRYNVTVFEPAAASSHGTRIPILFDSIEIHGPSLNRSDIIWCSAACVQLFTGNISISFIFIAAILLIIGLHVYYFRHCLYTVNYKSLFYLSLGYVRLLIHFLTAGMFFPGIFFPGKFFPQNNPKVQLDPPSVVSPSMYRQTSQMQVAIEDELSYGTSALQSSENEGKHKERLVAHQQSGGSESCTDDISIPID